MADSKEGPTPQKWENTDFAPLTPENLQALFDNKIPAIRIPDFFSSEECDALLKSLEANSFLRVTESVKKGEVSIILPDESKAGNMRYTGHVTRIGISQSEYPWSEQAKYFSQVAEKQAVFNEAAKLGIDPIKRLIDLVQKNSKGKVSIAEQPADSKVADDKAKSFFCGIVRQVNGGTYPHFDWAPFHAGEPWAISRVNSQLSWNLFLTQPLGGNTVVYDQQWVPALEELRKGDLSAPYPKDLLSTCKSIVSKPMHRAVVIFNSRNFHEVLATDTGSGKRITVSSFVGRTTNGDVLFWS